MVLKSGAFIIKAPKCGQGVAAILFEGYKMLKQNKSQPKNSHGLRGFLAHAHRIQPALAG